jgi:hypothetical protein
MLPAQLIVDVFQCLADFLIVLFFIIELRGSRKERELNEQQVAAIKKQTQVLEDLHKALHKSAAEEIELLEDVHAELADINDKQPEILNEEQEKESTPTSGS